MRPVGLGLGTLVLLAAVVAGAVASVAGFGIGSILTPLLAWQRGTKLAVAAVSIPHLAGTALRLWRLRGHIDRRVLLSFGLASAAGGLLRRSGGAFGRGLAPHCPGHGRGGGRHPGRRAEPGQGLADGLAQGKADEVLPHVAGD
jgi:hypothetical protein